VARTLSLLPHRAITAGVVGCHPAPNMKTDRSQTFPSGILHIPLVCSAWSHIKLVYQLIIFSNSFHEPGYKSPNLMSGTCHSTSTGVLSAKHSTTNGFPPRWDQGDIQKGIMHSRIPFNSYNINAQVSNNLKTVVKRKPYWGCYALVLAFA
jgi:hypothetical protein